MLPEAAGRGQHFQARGHSSSLYGPTLSRQITFFFLRLIGLEVGLRNFVIELAGLTCRLLTIVKNLTCERARKLNLDTKQRNMY